MIDLLIIFFVIILFLGCCGRKDTSNSSNTEWNDDYDDGSWEFPSKHSTEAIRRKTSDENVIS